MSTSRYSYRPTLALVKTCWKLLEDVSSITFFCLLRHSEDVLVDKKFLDCIMTKTSNHLWSHQILVVFCNIVRPKALDIFTWQRYWMCVTKWRENLGILLWFTSAWNYIIHANTVTQDSRLLFVYKIITTISFIVIRKRFF